jgi:hypothetical protein
MKRKKQKEWALELVLALAAAGATAFLLALIARYDMGMSNATIRTGALYAAGPCSPRSPAVH